MSVINRMLQDLDARGAGSDTGAPLPVQAVLRPAPRLVPRVALAVSLCALLVVLLLAAWFGWRALQTKPTPVAPNGPMPLAPLPAGMVRVTPPQPVPDAPARQAVVSAAVDIAAPAAPAAPAPPAPPVRKARPAPPPVIAARPVSIVPASTDANERDNLVTRSAAPTGARGSEADYRRALADLQSGRVIDAIAALEQALVTDPRHDSARQTLVALLLEAGRRDEALQHLQRALALDPRQPAQAMLLARLQLEAGPSDSSAVDTLLRTLPYAQGGGDYQAFLAAVLQRQQRHAEAVRQYRAALAATPGNPVWLMGLGMSLQAQQHGPEALAAFQQAAASGALAPEVQGFVEGKIRQLKQSLSSG